MKIIHVGNVLGLLMSVGCADDAPSSTSETHGRDTAVDSASIHYDMVYVSAPAGYKHAIARAVTSNRDVLLFAGCYDGSCSDDLYKVDLAGNASLLAQNFFPEEVTPGGLAGGCFLGNEEHAAEAAIVDAAGEVERVRGSCMDSPGCVERIADGRTTLLREGDHASVYSIVEAGQAFPVTLEDFPGDPVTSDTDVLAISATGELVGDFIGRGGVPTRAFRYDGINQTTTRLEPIDGDFETYAFAINERGDVLGVSFTEGNPAHVGVWNAKNQFKTYATLGPGEFPSFVPHAWWDGNGFLLVRADRLYVVPEPGVLLDIADLVDDPDSLPWPAPDPSAAGYPMLPVSVNARGDFLVVDKRGCTPENWESCPRNVLFLRSGG